MMRFFILFAIVMQICSFAKQNAPFQTYTTTLIHADKKAGKIADSKLIHLGSSGVVMHSFDAQKSTIVSRATVVKKDGKYAYLRFDEFNMLNQEAFPSLGIVPQKGDKAILNYLYGRSLIVAPNETIYKKVTKTFPGIEWIHPDLIAAHLSINYKPNPNKHNFDVMCDQNSAGLILFALNKKGYFADCKSLKILKSFALPSPKNYQLPFYNRLGEIETVFWKWGGKKIKNYNAYYKKLLGLK